MNKEPSRNRAAILTDGPATIEREARISRRISYGADGDMFLVESPMPARTRPDSGGMTVEQFFASAYLAEPSE